MSTMIRRLHHYLRIVRVLSRLNADGTHALADFAEIVGQAQMFRLERTK
jgi:hypothetical protein